MTDTQDDKIADSTASAPRPCWMQISDILHEEANQLALWKEINGPKDAPHRVKLSISREIKRLRDLAAELETDYTSNKEITRRTK